MNGIYEEIRIALHTIWLRRWLALGVAWAVCLVGWLVVSLIPNRYESEAQIVVEAQSLLTGKVGMTELDSQREIDQMRQTLTSAENLEAVVRDTVLVKEASNAEDIAALAAGLRSRIQVVGLPENIFKISAQTSYRSLSNAENAQLSHDVVKKLLDLFVKNNVVGSRVEAEQSLKIIDATLKRRTQELSEADSKRAAFEQKYLGSIPGTGSIDQRIEAARNELVQLDGELAAARSSASAASAQMSSVPSTLSTPPMGAGVSRVAALEAQLAEATARGWTDRHPDVVSARQQLARLRESGEGSSVSGGQTPNPVYMSMRAMAVERQAMAAAVAARKAQIQNALNRLVSLQVSQPGIVVEQARLSRDYDALKAQYDKLVSDREDIRLRGDVANGGGSVKFRIINPPSRPHLPAAPSRLLLLVGVLLVGLAAGAAVAFIKGKLRTTYPTSARLRAATGLKVIGSIPKTLSVAALTEQKKWNRWFYSGAGALAGAFVLLMLVEIIERGLTA